LVNYSHFIPQSEFLSIKEFAAKVGAHTNTIRRAIRKGKISACDIGSGKRKIFRIAASELDRMCLLNLQDIVDKMVEKRMKDV